MKTDNSNAMDDMRDAAERNIDAARNAKKIGKKIKKLSQKSAKAGGKSAAGGGKTAGAVKGGGATANAGASAGGGAAAGSGAAGGASVAGEAASAAGTAAGGAAGAGAAAGTAGSGGGGLLAALATPEGLLIVGIIAIILLLVVVVSDSIDPSSSNNTPGGRIEEAQKRDYIDDKEAQKQMEKLDKKIEEAEKMEDGDKKVKKLKELNGQKEKLIRKYTMDNQFEYLAKIMIDEADGAYEEAKKKYNEEYKKYAEDPKYRTHDDLEGQTVYQNPENALFYKDYSVDPLTGKLIFKESDKVEPRGNSFVDGTTGEDLTSPTNEEGKTLDRAPTTGIAYVIAAYHVSRGGTVPVVHTADDAKKFAYYERFREIIEEAKGSGSLYEYRDTLNEEKKRQSVYVVRFKDATILQKDNREESKTRNVPAMTPVEEEFEYTEYSYHGEISPFNIGRILEIMFLEDNEFYADALATYTGPAYTGDSGSSFGGTDGSPMIGSGFTGNVDDAIKSLKASWPEKMDPRRITLIKTALSATKGGVKYVYGRGHSLQDLQNPKCPYMDCSGLVGWAHVISGNDFGIVARGRAPEAKKYKLMPGVKKISLKDLMPGDIVCKDGKGAHTGIYVGRNSSGQRMFVHSQGKGSASTITNPGKGPQFNNQFCSAQYGVRIPVFNDNQKWEGTENLYKKDEAATKKRNEELEKERKKNDEKRDKKYDKLYKEIEELDSSLLNYNVLDRLKYYNPSGKSTSKTIDANGKMKNTKQNQKAKKEEDLAAKLALAGNDENPTRDDSVVGHSNGYKIADSEIKEIANLCYSQQQSKKGVAALASMYVNTFEKKIRDEGKKELKAEELMSYIKNKGKFIDGSETGEAPEEMQKIVKSIVVNGIKGVPGYVEEYVKAEDIKSAKNDGVDVTPDKYEKDKTVIEMQDGTTFVFDGQYGNLITGYTNRDGRSENDFIAFDYEKGTPFSNNINEFGNPTNSDYAAASALEHVLNSPYYQWYVYYNHDCDHEPSMDYLCKHCHAKPKINTTGILFWKKEFTDYEFRKAEYPDKTSKMRIDSDGKLEDVSDDTIIVKRKIQMYADEMRNTIEKDLRTEDEMLKLKKDDGKFNAMHPEKFKRIVLEYDAGGFDIDAYLAEKGTGSSQTYREGLVSGTGMDGRLEVDALISEARKHIGERPDATVYPHFNNGKGWNWCSGFVTMCADNVGITDKKTGMSAKFGNGIIPRTLSTKDGARAFAKEGRFHYANSSYQPQPGDIVYFAMATKKNPTPNRNSISSINHVGIVTSVETSGKFMSIEGNTSGPGSGSSASQRVVAEKERPRAWVVGFGVPAYRTGPDGGPLVSGTLNEKVIESLLRAGFSEAAVAGIYGNFYGECDYDRNGQLNISLVEHKGTGVGLAQWTADRKPPFLSFLKQKGYTLKNAPIEIQLEYFYKEIDAGGVWLQVPDKKGYSKYMKGKPKNISWEEFKRVDDPVYATAMFCKNYERPGKPHMEKRIRGSRKAQEIIRKVKKNMASS